MRATWLKLEGGKVWVVPSKHTGEMGRRGGSSVRRGGRRIPSSASGSGGRGLYYTRARERD